MPGSFPCVSVVAGLCTVDTCAPGRPGTRMRLCGRGLASGLPAALLLDSPLECSPWRRPLPGAQATSCLSPEVEAGGGGRGKPGSGSFRGLRRGPRGGPGVPRPAGLSLQPLPEQPGGIRVAPRVPGTQQLGASRRGHWSVWAFGALVLGRARRSSQRGRDLSFDPPLLAGHLGL